MINGVDTTAFSLDIYGRFISNSWMEEVEGRGQDFDVVIIGSGMFGAYAASHIYNQSKLLADQGKLFRPLKVLVLEAGPFLFIEHQQNQNIFIDTAGDPTVRNDSPKLNESQSFVWGWDWRWNSEITGYVPTAYCVGGKSLFWGGWCPRMTPTDLANWPKEVVDYLVNDTASPVTQLPYEDPINNLPIKGAYSVLEYETGVLPADDFIFDPKLGPNSVGGLNEVLGKKLTNIFSTQPWNDSPTVLGPRVGVQTQSFISGLFALDKYSSLPGLITAIRTDAGDNAADRRLILVPNTKVTGLISGTINENGKTVPVNVITQIKVRLQNGDERILGIPDSCQVVLAMNTIDSTRLALDSFPGMRKSRDQSGNVITSPDLAGSNLMVHFRFDLFFRIKRTDFDPGLAAKLNTAITHIQFNNPGEGRYHFQFYAADNDQGSPDAYLYRFIPDYDYLRSINNSRDPNDFVQCIIRTTGEMKGLILNKENIETYDKHRGGQDFIDLTLGNNIPSDIDPIGNTHRAWVQFNRADHYNDPIWKIMYDQAIKLSLSLAGNVAANVQYKVFDQASLSYTNNYSVAPPDISLIGFKQSLGSTYHEAGTLWMGDDPDTSVTDTNGHFHQVANLYAAGQPLFPTIGSANPVLTGLTVTRKIADDIISRHLSDQFKADLTGFTKLDDETKWENLSKTISKPLSGFVFLKDAANNSVWSSFFGNDIGFIWFTTGKFQNFELYTQWRVERSISGEVANSGLLLRMPDPSTYDPANTDPFYSGLIEIQIDDSGKNFEPGRPSFFGSMECKTGAVYKRQKAIRWSGKINAHNKNLFATADGGNTIIPDENFWNTYHITCANKTISVELNGTMVSQTVNLPDNLNKPGFIGLQVHTGNVQFRNIYIKELI
jgi:choline dehydrogenase-like flavoprotein